MKSFKQFLKEDKDKKCFFVFGKMNPPTLEHGKLLEKVSSIANSTNYQIYLNQSDDLNLLEYSQKVKYARKMFPKHSRNIIKNENINNIFDVLHNYYNEGCKNLNMVVGHDRVNDFKELIESNNGKKTENGYYYFNTINIISTGEKDPESSTKMRHFAENNDFRSFIQGLPREFSNINAKKLFNDIRESMGFRKEKSFKDDININMNIHRENYVNGEIYNTGELINIIKENKIGTIKKRCTNYVIVEVNGQEQKHWLKSIRKITEEEKMALKVSDGIGAWIKDFYKSNAPQFKGKNKEERRDMAVAAYLDAKNGKKVNEKYDYDDAMKNLTKTPRELAKERKTLETNVLKHKNLAAQSWGREQEQHMMNMGKARTELAAHVKKHGDLADRREQLIKSMSKSKEKDFHRMAANAAKSGMDARDARESYNPPKTFDQFQESLKPTIKERFTEILNTMLDETDSLYKMANGVEIIETKIDIASDLLDEIKNIIDSLSNDEINEVLNPSVRKGANMAGIDARDIGQNFNMSKGSRAIKRARDQKFKDRNKQRQRRKEREYY